MTFTRTTTASGLMDVVSAPMSVPPPRPVSLLVSLSGLEPGAPLDAAVRLADALDARRVPLTLLAGARPHPEVVAWVAARRRTGDAVLLHGTGGPEHPGALRRLPGHEAGLRLAGALRARDGVGLDVDGFAAPGWAVSDGVRRALVAAGVDLLVDDEGVHRLGEGGTTLASVPGRVVEARGTTVPAVAARSRWTRPARRRPATAVRHHTLAPATRQVDHVLASVDADLEAGAVPDTAPGLLTPRRATRRARDLGDPEFWSITA